MSESAPGSASTGEASPASSSSSSSSSTATAAALRTAEARESALRAARLRRLAQRQDREAEEARRREEKEEYTKKYDVAARKWVSTMIALPILLVTSYYLFDRRAVPFLSISSASLLAHCFISFRTILPLASFGTSSTNLTPPTSRLCLATREAVQSWMSLGVTLPFEAGWITTYARGHSSSPLPGRSKRGFQLRGGDLHAVDLDELLGISVSVLYHVI
ncbi:hypothetical protein Trco_002390 [Trichoderma cornu-damae]|uniref:Uncharacterized protein n=1 Tax=Trichoderma cornu-damae TaxID=654480 RepID=A0A9P8QPR6_9HYPO|nr:hypothetical protein Trco_002390 [Trichoderma cornu-damae]